MDKHVLRQIAEASIRRSLEECEDSPLAVMRAVRTIMLEDSTISEAEAFELVWSLWLVGQHDT